MCAILHSAVYTIITTAKKLSKFVGDQNILHDIVKYLHLHDNVRYFQQYDNVKYLQLYVNSKFVPH